MALALASYGIGNPNSNTTDMRGSTSECDNIQWVAGKTLVLFLNFIHYNIIIIIIIIIITIIIIIIVIIVKIVIIIIMIMLL